MFTLVVFVALVALGGSSLLTIPKAEDPTFPYPNFAVIAVLPGASPADVERLVVDPIEAELKWLDDVKNQVVRQFNAIKSGTIKNGFAAAFTAPMTITGSAKIFSIYTSELTFNGQVIVKISTDGKFLIGGKLNFAADQISLSAKLYADLSKIATGTVKSSSTWSVS